MCAAPFAFVHGTRHPGTRRRVAEGRALSTTPKQQNKHKNKTKRHSIQTKIKSPKKKEKLQKKTYTLSVYTKDLVLIIVRITTFCLISLVTKVLEFDLVY